MNNHVKVMKIDKDLIYLSDFSIHEDLKVSS